MADISFEFAEKSKKLNKVESRAFSIMEANEQYKPVLQRIQADLGEKEKESKLRITFIGQYSAGKSTIISALTGNDNIKIDSNISTDKTTTYPWRDVLLVDTPGLYTEHPEHDAITEEAIKQADIVVYCLTFSLFDELLLKDFQKLAYERGYSGKMFLVVNKMNGEYGSYEELVGNYKKSLIKDLGEEKLNKFPLCFIVAQWQRESDPGLRKESHFDDFIIHLNDFISVNGQMAKLLGPANIFIDNIQQGIIENNDSENREFFLILDRVDRQFKKQERECDSFFLSLIDDLHTKIVNAGYQLANMHAESQSEAEEASRKVDVQMEQYCNSATQSLEKKFESVQEELNSALKEISESELVMNFYAASEIKPVKIKHGVSFQKNNAANIELIKNFFSGAKDGAAGIAKAAEGAKAGAGLLTPGGAAGGALHQIVLNVGHFFGATFKPWQAVNIAKGIGNFAKVLGPILIAVPVVMEAVDIAMEKQQEKKEQERRSSLLTEVFKQANFVVQQYKDQYSEYKEQAIGKNLKMIKKMRDQRTMAVKLIDKTAKELKSCVEDFKHLIGG